MEQVPKQGVQPQPRHEELCLMCLMHRVCGRARLRPTVLNAHRSRPVMTSNGSHACCASRAWPRLQPQPFPAGACRLISCLHHRRAHGLLGRTCR